MPAFSARPTRSSHSSARAAGTPYSAAKVRICSRAVSRSKNADACSCTPIRGSSRGLRGHGALAQQPDRARVGPAQALDHLQRGGLAGAVGAEDAEELPLGHVEATPRRRPAAPRRTCARSTTSIAAMPANLARSGPRERRLSRGAREVADGQRSTPDQGRRRARSRAKASGSGVAGDQRPGPGRLELGGEAEAASPRRRSGRRAGRRPGARRRRCPQGTAAAGLPATFHSAAYAIIGIARSAARTVPAPSRTPTLRRPVRDRRGQQDVDVVEDPVGLRARPSRSAAAPQSITRGRHPGAEPVGLAGTPLEPVVVLDRVGLGRGCRRRTAGTNAAVGSG